MLRVQTSGYNNSFWCHSAKVSIRNISVYCCIGQSKRVGHFLRAYNHQKQSNQVYFGEGPMTSGDLIQVPNKF